MEFTAEQKDQMKQLLRNCGDSDKTKALAAQRAIAQALQTPLRSGVLMGDILAGIYAREVFDPGAPTRYPIDLFRPDNDGEYNAYVIPNQGAIPSRSVAGDYVMVPTYKIGNGIDFLLDYAREARFDVMRRALEVMEAGFTKKLNDDGWHTILAAAVDRNILVNDTNAAVGQFTKRLVSLMKLIMRRNAGGNSTSVGRGSLTHLFLSPEAVEDMRNWDLSEIDDITRREIYLADDGTFNRVFGVTLVDLDELGEGQEYQDFYTNELGASLASGGDVEVLVGLDANRNDSFVMPVREELQIFEDDTYHRSQRMGFYGWQSQGFAALDNRALVLASI